MDIEDFETLYAYYKANTKQDLFTCVCENCHNTYTVKRITIKRQKARNDSHLICKACRISLTKQAYDEQTKERINAQREKTNEEKYGCKNTWQLEKVKEMSRNRDWTERNEHSRATCMEKYGVDNPIKTKEIQGKIKENLISKYGSVEASYKERVAKAMETNLQKYGYKSNFQEEDFHEKAISKQISTYGRPIYSRTYIYNDICFDSSWELAYYIWLTDAKIEFTYQPQCNFYYMGSDNKQHQYFPDFYVNGEYQEIKGNQFFNENMEPYCEITKTYWWEKYNFIKENGIRILTWTDLKPIMEYITRTYGSKYLKSFKNKV